MKACRFYLDLFLAKEVTQAGLVKNAKRIFRRSPESARLGEMLWIIGKLFARFVSPSRAQRETISFPLTPTSPEQLSNNNSTLMTQVTRIPTGHSMSLLSCFSF